MNVDDPSGLWTRLPPAIQDRIDAELRHRRLISGVVVLRDEGGLDPKPSLYEAQEIVALRLRWLIAHGMVEPEPIFTAADLVAKATAIGAPVVAIEAIWDGDTSGWFVALLAIVEQPGPAHERFDDRLRRIVRRTIERRRLGRLGREQ